MALQNNKKVPDEHRAPNFSVQDEIKRNRRLRETGRIRQARSKARAMFTILLCVAMLTLTVAAILLAVMRVKTVTVSGNDRYDAQAIIDAAGISGGILPFLRDDSVEKDVVSVCPYVDDVKLVKTYPSSVEIVVSETTAVYVVNVRDELFSLDINLRVIDRVDSEVGLIKLMLNDIRSAIEGEALKFYDEANNNLTLTLLEELAQNGDLPITYLDLRDRFNLVAKIGNSVKIEFGDYNYIDEKVKLAKKILDTSEAKLSDRSLIDVSVPQTPSAMFDYEGEF